MVDVALQLLIEIVYTKKQQQMKRGGMHSSCGLPRLVAWFSFRLRGIPGSIPGAALLLRRRRREHVAVIVRLGT